MKRPLLAAPIIVALGLGLVGLAGAGSAAADPIPPPPTAPAEVPLPAPDPTLPALPPLPSPLPTLPIPGGAGSGSPSPSPSPSGTPTELPTGPTTDCPKVTGTTIQFCYQHGFDRTSWYWKDQQYQNVNPGPVNQQLTFPDPQAQDTIPVTIMQSDLDRVSAIYFNLVGHGVPVGATITKFVLQIQEGAAPTGPEQPEYNASGQIVEACPATKIWAAGAAELWDTKPTWSDTGCVKGEVDDSTEAPTWTFDLTPLATEWASDPFTSNGVVFVPRSSGGPADSNYQINFKIPSRDDSTTPTVNEYDSTKGRTLVTVSYQQAVPSPPPTQSPKPEPPHSPKPPKPTTQPPPPPPPPVGGGGGGSSTGGGSSCCDTGGSTGGGTGPVTGGSNTDFGGGGNSGTTPVEQSAPSGFLPVRFPWYAWLVLPVALLALAAVRSILFEQAQGVRPGGVISAIRARNAAARGEPAGSGGSGAGGGVLQRMRQAAREGMARGTVRT